VLLPVPTVVELVVLLTVLLLVLVLTGGLRRRCGAPVLVLPVLTPALTAAVGLEVRNAPRTPSSSSCACTHIVETLITSAIKRGKT
jgi:hypothetical protein